jgi:hypothetical protein
LTPRPSGIDCDWAKFDSYPGLYGKPWERSSDKTRSRME